MPPLVIDMMDRWRADLLAGEGTATRRMAQAWLAVETSLQAQVDALAFEMAAQRGSMSMYQLRRMERYQALMVQVQAELDKYARWVEQVVTERQRTAATLGVDHAAQAVRVQQADAGTAVQTGFDRLPVSAVEYMVGNTANGSPVRDVLLDASRIGPEALATELINGLALGRNPVETARRAMRMGLGRSFSRMVLIARTETLRVYRQATIEGYKATGGLVTGYRRVAAKSERTCLGCLMADGRFYELTIPFEEHPNGRCVAIPEIRGKPATTWQTGQEWFKTLPAQTQRGMMGPSRFELWQDGVISLDDLIEREEDPTWGGSLRPAPVRRLMERAGREMPTRTTTQSPAPARPVTPAGVPVSLAADLRATGKVKKAIEAALQAIDEVHGDGTLDPLPFLRGAGKKELGLYKSTPSGVALNITVGANNPIQHLTTAHEVGHWLDDQAIGVAIRSPRVTMAAHKDPTKAASLQQAIDQYWNAVTATKTYKYLDGLWAPGKTVPVKIPVYGPTGVVDKIFNEDIDRYYLRYLTSREELWARTYAQYIATRSSNVKMKAELLTTLESSKNYPQQWEENEFKPVAKAIDAIMAVLGWRL